MPVPVPAAANDKADSIDAAVESRGWTPVLIAWFSAGNPNAS